MSRTLDTIATELLILAALRVKQKNKIHTIVNMTNTIITERLYNDETRDALRELVRQKLA